MLTAFAAGKAVSIQRSARSEEHTSELQSPCNLVCRLLLEKKNEIRNAVRLQQEGRVLDHVRPEGKLARNVQLQRLCEQADVRIFWELRVPLLRSAFHVRQSRVGVLRVIDGVLVALRDSQLQVELDRGVRRSQQIEVANGV